MILPKYRCRRNQNDYVDLIRWGNLRLSQREVAFAYARAEQRHPSGVWFSVATMVDQVNARRRDLADNKEYKPMIERTFKRARKYLASEDGNVLIQIGVHEVHPTKRLPIFVLNGAELWSRNLQNCPCKGACESDKTYWVTKRVLGGVKNARNDTQYSNKTAEYGPPIKDWESPY